MTVTTTRALGNVSTHIRHRGVRREGIVGTLSVAATATGDGSGGVVNLILSMNGTEFGFKFMFVPTLVSFRDGLATAVDVRLQWLGNNERITGGLTVGTERRASMVAAGGENVGQLEGSHPIVAIPTNPDGVARNVVQAIWGTNTNATSYNMFMYGVLYDEEYRAKFTDLVVDGPLAGPL